MTEMRHSNFVHLHLHTDYSLLDGACEISALVEHAVRLKMPAVAVTDHGNLFAASRFYHEAVTKGIKPIIGCEVYVARASRFDRTSSQDGERAHHLLILCESNEGYRNLIKLVSAGFLEGFYYKPRIDKELLRQHSRGLIATSGCLRGEVASALAEGNYKAAKSAAYEFQEIFGKGNFYLEIQDQGVDTEQRINPELVRLSRETGITLVATNDCHYLHREDARAQDVLVCIQTGKTLSDPSRMKFATEEFYFKTREEMMKPFGEIPEVLDRTVEVAERCHVKLERIRNPFPHFDVPEGHSPDSYFEKMVREGFAARVPRLEAAAQKGLLRHKLAEYEARLSREIQMIQKMRFAGYFLIVSDFIAYARTQEIPVGPGRGSAAGSLASYSLGITNIDPLQYGLLFERFLNPERVSLPDIDIDFCMRRRDEVIRYVREKYGRDNVAQIITFGTMAAKAVIKDTARVMEMPYAEADRLAKMVPAELNITLDDALAKSPPLKAAQEREGRVKELIEVARKLEGLVRHASTHAAGVVISPEPLTEIVPLYKTNREEIVTQYDMNELERLGLLKMDFLALATLTVLDDAVKLIEGNRGVKLELENIPLDDPATYRLFAEANTSGIFQFESPGMREILRRYEPQRIEDLTALNALYRPGPIQGGMIDYFIQRKQGEKKVEYDLPELEDILAETYGVIVYQEQVMQIANRLAGFSLGDADLLRRAMGKKKPEEMAAQRERFLAGCRSHKVPEKKASKIFDLMEQFAGYGFAKSHSAAYALLAYQTGYLKVHYPVEFMAALLTSEMGKTEKIVKYINECREMNITVLPPDVNSSSTNFTPAGEAIRFGLAAIRNVGENTVGGILEARQRLGKFTTLFQFCEEIELRLLNKRVLESLVKSGALDSLGGHRAELFAGLDRAIERAQKKQRDRQSGQGSFGLLGDIEREMGQSRPVGMPEVDEWPEHKLLAYEKETLGFYISGHPLAKYASRLEELTVKRAESLEEGNHGEEVRLAGLVSGIRIMRSKKGDRWAMVELEDMTGIVDLLVFPEAYSRLEHFIKADAALLIKGKLSIEDAGTRVMVSDAKPLEDAAEPAPTVIRVRVDPDALGMAGVDLLRALFARKPGSCRVAFDLEGDGYRATMETGKELRVNPDRELVERLREICGKNAVHVIR